ncbi:hypothetical protein A33Q_1742 [Indibacter alkaliphilus LW1]|uniref:Uncharacterized protein n=1 Tax=Indibacter alkaliphilus (strain CCUG 57479 / KCTC 22604 / LW1) TaxID=1189612 RepID=S2E4N9_INDAL|nr:hypothetical protein [Indibacter alkaliphilus]EOZ97203.1 hypothetical protein A33Q_1742 [Indibacter alkaliphilus LW1]
MKIKLFLIIIFPFFFFQACLQKILDEKETEIQFYLDNKETIWDIAYHQEAFYLLTNKHNFYVFKSNGENKSKKNILYVDLNSDGTVNYYPKNMIRSFHIWKDKVYFLGHNPGNILVTDLKGVEVDMLIPEYNSGVFHDLVWAKESQIIVNVYHPGLNPNYFELYLISLESGKSKKIFEYDIGENAAYIKIGLYNDSNYYIIHPNIDRALVWKPFLGITDSVFLPDSNIRYQGKLDDVGSDLSNWKNKDKYKKNRTFPDEFVGNSYKNEKFYLLSKILQRDSVNRYSDSFLMNFGNEHFKKEFFLKDHVFVKTLGDNDFYLGVLKRGEYQYLVKRFFPKE